MSHEGNDAKAERDFEMKKERPMTSPPKAPLTSRVMAEIIYNDEMSQADIAKSNKKINTFWIASGSIFHRFGEPRWGVLGGSSRLLVGVFLPLGAILEPRWLQDLSKRPPGPILDDFWTDFD